MAPAFEPVFDKLSIFAEAMTEADVRPKSGAGRGEAALAPGAALRKNNEFQKRYAEFASYLDVRTRRAAEELRSASNELSSNAFRVKLFTDCLKANAVPQSLRSRSFYFLRYCDDQLFEEWETVLHETSLSLLQALLEHLRLDERKHIEAKMADALVELSRPDGELGEARAHKLAEWLQKERNLIESHYDEPAVKSQLNKIVEEYGSTHESHRKARGPPNQPRRGPSASRNLSMQGAGGGSVGIIGGSERGSWRSSQSKQRQQQQQQQLKQQLKQQQRQQMYLPQQQQQYMPQQQWRESRARGGRSVSRGMRR